MLKEEMQEVNKVPECWKQLEKVEAEEVEQNHECLKGD